MICPTIIVYTMALFLPYILLPVGIILISWGLGALRVDLTKSLWAMVPGRITRCEMITRDTSRGQKHSFVALTICVEYLNEIYCGTVYPFCIGNMDSARSVADKYPENSTVEVFVLKTNPRVIRLKRGISTKTWLLLSLGTVCLGMCALLQSL